MNPWTEWKKADGSAVSVSGDPSYGTLQLNEACYGPVVDLSTAATRLFSVENNKYAAGSGTATKQIRGSDAPFLWDDALPEWETPPVQHRWRYVQIRLTS
jgi:hypothetical protein